MQITLAGIDKSWCIAVCSMLLSRVFPSSSERFHTCQVQSESAWTITVAAGGTREAMTALDAAGSSWRVLQKNLLLLLRLLREMVHQLPFSHLVRKWPIAREKGERERGQRPALPNRRRTYLYTIGIGIHASSTVAGFLPVTGFYVGRECSRFSHSRAWWMIGIQLTFAEIPFFYPIWMCREKRYSTKSHVEYDELCFCYNHKKSWRSLKKKVLFIMHGSWSF